MKEIKLKVELGIGFSGCRQEDVLTIEVEDNETEEQIEKVIEETVAEWANNYIDYGYEILD